MKQTVYVTLSAVALLVFTFLTVIEAKKSEQDKISIYDVNGQKRDLSHQALYNFLIVGWVSYIVAVICNISYYAVHPSEVDFDEWDDKFKFYFLGTLRDWSCGTKPERENVHGIFHGKVKL